MRRAGALLPGLVCAAVLAAGCGGDEETTSGATAPDPAAATEVEDLERRVKKLEKEVEDLSEGTTTSAPPEAGTDTGASVPTTPEAGPGAVSDGSGSSGAASGGSAGATPGGSGAGGAGGSGGGGGGKPAVEDPCAEHQSPVC